MKAMNKLDIKNQLSKDIVMHNIKLDTIMIMELKLILIKKKHFIYMNCLPKKKIVMHRKVLHFYMNKAKVQKKV